MNKVQLAEEIAEKLNISKTLAQQMLETFEELVTSSLKGGTDVTLSGFGSFSAKFRSARLGVNPLNPKEKIKMPALYVPKFKAGKALKDALKERPVE